MSSANVVLHSVCTHLLIKVCCSEHGSKPSPWFLLNLSLVEMVRNLVDTVNRIVLAVSYDNKSIPYNVINISILYISISAMFLLTGDRLIAIILSIRYQVYCTVYRTKAAIMSTWCFFISAIPPILVGSYLSGGWNLFIDAVKVALWFYGLVLCILFFVFSVVTYIVMFVYYVRSKRSSSSSHQSSLELFKHSNFHIAVLLISSFLVLTVIPLLILHTYYTILDVQVDRTLHKFINILLSLSDTVDALIYVFLYSPVRKLIKTYFITWCSQLRQSRNSQAISPGAIELNNLPAP